MTSELIDDIIDQCWDRVVEGDTTVASRILVVINEFERILAVKSLFLRDELSLLESMIDKSPDLTLKKSEFKQFVLRLVKYHDFDKFLLDRFNISYGDLLEVANSRPFETRPFVRNSNLTSSNTKSKFNRFQLASEIASKENDIIYRDNEIVTITRENEQLHRDIKRVNLELIDVKSQLDTTNHYVAQLESLLREKSSSTLPVKSIENLKKIKQQDLMIKLLEKENLQLQQNLNEFVAKDSENAVKFKQLADQIHESTKLLETIKTKLELNKNSNDEKAQSFIRNLPFIKQYYLYYAYKHQNSNPGMIILNITTLLFTTILLLNLLQLLVYVVTSLFAYQPVSEYVYDGYGARWYDFKIWNKFDVIEATLWELEDWLNW